MHIIKKISTLLLLFPCTVIAQSAMQTNPLLIHSNSPIAFNKVNATAIKEATETIIKISDYRIHKLVAIPAGKKTVANTLMGFDELSYDLSDFGAKLSVIASTYQDDATRNEANDQLEKLSSYGSDLYLNEPLYKALKSFA